jgi:hypothetical protein
MDLGHGDIIEHRPEPDTAEKPDNEEEHDEHTEYGERSVVSYCVSVKRKQEKHGSKDRIPSGDWQSVVGQQLAVVWSAKKKAEHESKLVIHIVADHLECANRLCVIRDGSKRLRKTGESSKPDRKEEDDRAS